MPLESPRCIDIHSHHRQADGCFRIIRLDARTFESDVGHDYPYSLGLHPWHVERQDCDAGLRKIQDAIDDNNMLADGKLDPTPIKVADISKTYNCPFAQFIRIRLRKHGIHRGLKTVFSPEVVVKESLMMTDGSNYKKSAYGTISYLPAAFGGVCASVVIRNLIHEQAHSHADSK